MGGISKMNERQISFYLQMIKDRIAALENQSELGKESQSVVVLDQQSVGRLSRMDALQNQAMAKAQHARRETEMASLRAALRRIHEGEFGFCEDCGDDIAPKRLELNLTATRCISCANG